MKQYWIQRIDGVTRFELREVPVPEPAPDQVLMRVRAASFNYGDAFARIARHRADAPRPAGVDAAGEVAAAGSAVHGVQPGTRIMARARGGFAEYVLVDRSQIMIVPSILDDTQAAAVPIAYITAYEALIELGELRFGETVLIAGASSGVGVACVQIAKRRGARVLGTSGSTDKLVRLRALGLDAGIVARGGDFAGAVLDANQGRPVDLAVDLVGGSAFPACQRTLGDFGRLAVVGYVDGQMQAQVDIESLHGKRLHIFGVSNTPLSEAQRASATAGFVREVLPEIATGNIVPVVDRVFGFESVEAAWSYAASGALLGKVILRVP